MGCGAGLQGFGTVEAARRGSEMMSAAPRRTALPAPGLRVDGETLAGTKSQVEPLELELIERVLTGQHEAFANSCVLANMQYSWLLKPF